LSEVMDIIHVSTGDILREAVKGGTDLGEQVKTFLNEGKLVPDGLMGDVIEDRLGRDDAQKGFILDGFPRTRNQVDILDRVMGKLGVKLDIAFNLTAPEDEILRRLTGRRVCPGCNAVFHLEARPPVAAGICDECGSALVQRADDMESVILDRLDVFDKQTRPVAEAYREQGVLIEVEGVGDPEQIGERLKAELQQLEGTRR
jgi:adenylate kinase